MNAKQRLKARIGRKLSLAGFKQASATDDLQEQILELFQDYSKAPEERKAEVYLRGEKRIIKSLLPAQNAVAAVNAQSKRAFHSKVSRG